ncbi:hypothetical protein SBOR_9973 [Sclerotinia borealis F-4128]|uniref:Methyltransferase domain-containing protein n=1 Tax=Sclerotinia borealis (strain F-4128) TaxID=1432307 RepID=W9BYH1_SCLBF|nr:hypothetical protein SBOR_9973 [Sclerotinia borealis F-4128]
MRSNKPVQILFLASLLLLAAFIAVPSKARSKVPFSIPTLGTFHFIPISRPNLNAFMQQSEIIYQRAVAQRREIRRVFPNRGFFPAKDEITFKETPWSIWDLVTPSYGCPWEMERLGRVGEGGWWICGISKFAKGEKPCVVYSFGVGNDSSFEAEILGRTKCEIWGFDQHVPGFNFGPEVTEEMRGRAHFERNGANGATNERNRLYTIQELMKRNGHDYIDILKTDIEHSEYNALSSLNGHTLPGGAGASTSPDPTKPEFPIGQILVEMHIFEWQGITASVFLDWWESMEFRGLRALHREIDTVAPGMGVEGGVKLCSMKYGYMDITCVERDYLRADGN